MAEAVDFSNFLNGPDWQREETAKELTRSLKENGFVKLTNYGIPDDIVNNIFPWVRNFLFTYKYQSKLNGI